VRSRTQTLPAVATAVLLAGATAACGAAPPVQAVVLVGSSRTEFRVDVARTADQQREGLSRRTSLAARTGMLFQFGTRDHHDVWMAGTTIPLDVAWIADNTVLAVDTLQPCTQLDQDTCPRWTSPSPADALLEVPAGSLREVVPGSSVVVKVLV